MGQLATFVSKLESQGRLPSQIVVNLKQNVSAISLRNGKELQENRLGQAPGRASQRKKNQRLA